jgi:hypothetical protein
MFRFFQYIRRQPKTVRDNYAFGIAAGFTAIVFGFWILSSPTNNLGGAQIAEEEGGSSPFSTLINQTKEQFASVKKSITGTSTESQTEVVPEEQKSNEIILSEEDIEIAASKLEAATTTPLTKPEVIYKEVLIGTTSSAQIPQNSSSSTTLVE